MISQRPGWASVSDPNRRRREVRFAAAAASAATALLYFGIGAGVLKIVDKPTADTPDLFMFGAAAGAAFVLGAALLLALDHRGVWLLGAIFQVGVIVMYVAVSPQRTPPFEQWGILIKILQVAILAALVYLVVRQPARRAGRVMRSV
jgi:peptidoglycan/LPS O-acetylase OafA/YrhL